MPVQRTEQKSKHMEIIKRTLPNGLQVLVLETHAAPLVCSFIWYRVGLRHEGSGESGLSHFLEHMAFKGTERLSGREMDRLVTQRGGYLNGFTSMDYTAYVETLPREALDIAFEIESQRMTECKLSLEDIESEKGVVLSEFEGAENDPSFLLRREVMAAQFPNQPYGNAVIGKKEDLRDLNKDRVESYYKRHYAPNNAILVVVGDVNPEELFAKAEKYFGSIPRSEPTALALNNGRGPTGEKRVKLELPGKTSFLQAVYEVPAIQHPDHVTLEVLQNILSGGRTGRLYQALVDTGIASEAAGWDFENPQTTVFAFELSLRPGIEHQKAEAALDAVLEKLQRELVSERELTKAKNQTKAQFIYSADGVTKLAQQLGYYEAIYSHEYLRTFPEKVDAVTVKDIQRIVRKYFPHGNRTVGWLIATDEGGIAEEGIAPSSSDLRWHYRPDSFDASDLGSASTLTPVSPPSGLGSVAPVYDIRLSNGMQVIIERNAAAPFVSIYANIMAGPVFDPKDKGGMAAFCAEIVSRGTEKRTWPEIRESLEFVAAQLGFGTGSQVATVSGQCLREDLPLLLEAAAEQLIQPSFPSKEVEKVRSDLISAQERRDEDTYQVAENALFTHLYPDDHPLHHDELGTKETIGGITREELVAFHERWYRPENTILAIVGDIEPARAAELAERAFRFWPRVGEETRPNLPTVSVSDQPQVIRIPVPNKTQTDIALGFPGISRRDPAYYEADLMNYLLGRAFMSRLNMHIREELGLAYYVWSNYHALWGQGPWLLHMGVNPVNVDKALAAALDELKRMQKEPPPEEELNLWKGYVEGTVARQMETFAGIAQTLVIASFYDLGLYFPYEYPKILRAITADQVHNAAQRFLHPNGYVAVIAGPVELQNSNGSQQSGSPTK